VTRPRVVHVTTTDISLALLLGPQLRAFRDAGYEVVGVSAPGPFLTDLEAAGIRHVSLIRATRAMAPQNDVLAMAELYRILRELRPAIVHTHNPKPGIYGRIAGRAARVPVVVNTVHGLYATSDDALAKRALVYSLERLATLASDAELVQNVEDLETLARVGVPRRKLQLLGNGIDLRRFDPGRVEVARRKELRDDWGVGDDAVVCGVVGRLVWEKGYREIFEAARLLRERVPNVHFVVVGPTDDDKADAMTRQDRDAAARAGNVIFAGMRDDIEDCYMAFDLLALASYREGFPRAAMEAAAMGLPIVASDIRGCRQVVEPDRTGILVPVRDAPGIAAAVERVAYDDELRSRMGDAARAKALAEFDDRRCIEVTLATYERLLRKRKSR
jgi:glycosyltransferase involved in cell wall biosynthesis